MIANVFVKLCIDYRQKLPLRACNEWSEPVDTERLCTKLCEIEADVSNS